MQVAKARSVFVNIYIYIRTDACTYTGFSFLLFSLVLPFVFGRFYSFLWFYRFFLVFSTLFFGFTAFPFFTFGHELIRQAAKINGLTKKKFLVNSIFFGLTKNFWSTNQKWSNAMSRNVVGLLRSGDKSRLARARAVPFGGSAGSGTSDEASVATSAEATRAEAFEEDGSKGTGSAAGTSPPLEAGATKTQNPWSVEPPILQWAPQPKTQSPAELAPAPMTLSPLASKTHAEMCVSQFSLTLIFPPQPQVADGPAPLGHEDLEQKGQLPSLPFDLGDLGCQHGFHAVSQA